MDSARLLDSARDPYARRQTSSLPLSGSLSSGQPYYTVESLEGAASLPPLKSSFAPPPVPLPGDRDPLHGLDSRTRAIFSDRDALEARARLVAAEREALLRRTVPGAPSAERRAFTDGLLPADARSRIDGVLPLDTRSRLPYDELQGLDARARALGLDLRAQDALRPGIDDRARTFAPMGGLARGIPDSRSEILRARELAAVGRSSSAPFMSQADYRPGRRDIADFPPPPLPPTLPFSRRDRPAANFSRTERSGRTGKQAPPPSRSTYSEAGRKESKAGTNVKTPPAKLKSKPPVTPEESVGWCAVCKIDCCNTKTLNIHLTGKKHKANVEGKSNKPKESADEDKDTPKLTSKTDKKRTNEAKSEALPSAKRKKTSVPAVTNGATVKESDATKGKTDDSKKDKAKEKTAKDGKEVLKCEICKVFTTDQSNLDSHLKGKRHAARVKELAGSSASK